MTLHRPELKKQVFLCKGELCNGRQLLALTAPTFHLGPDICGPGTKKVHVIFNYKGKNVLINKDIRCKV